MSAIEPMLEHAMKYAARGVPVFPVDREKRPLTRHGFKDASTDERQLIAWWQIRWPNAGIAVPTGQASGIVVVDVDPDNGGLDGIADCTARFGQLPPTASSSTPSGGWHFFLRAPEGVEIRNSAGRLAAGVDVRGDGGYVVVPPSRNGSGSWTWNMRAKAADLPAAWLEAMTAATTAADGMVAATPPSEWVALLRGPIGEGTRNQSLTRLAGHFLRKYIDYDVALEVALAINAGRCKPPLPVDEVERIVDSVARAEARRRRRTA